MPRSRRVAALHTPAEDGEELYQEQQQQKAKKASTSSRVLLFVGVLVLVGLLIAIVLSVLAIPDGPFRKVVDPEAVTRLPGPWSSGEKPRSVKEALTAPGFISLVVAAFAVVALFLFGKRASNWIRRQIGGGATEKKGPNEGDEDWSEPRPRSNSAPGALAVSPDDVGGDVGGGGVQQQQQQRRPSDASSAAGSAVDRAANFVEEEFFGETKSLGERLVEMRAEMVEFSGVKSDHFKRVVQAMLGNTENEKVMSGMWASPDDAPMLLHFLNEFDFYESQYRALLEDATLEEIERERDDVRRRIDEARDDDEYAALQAEWGELEVAYELKRSIVAPGTDLNQRGGRESLRGVLLTRLVIPFWATFAEDFEAEDIFPGLENEDVFQRMRRVWDYFARYLR